MQDFFDKVGKQAIRAGNIAGNKASEMLEISKLKTKLNDVTQSRTLAKKEIGEYCYNMYKEGKINDPNILEFCRQIDATFEAAEEIERQMEAARAEYAAKVEVADPSLND